MTQEEKAKAYDEALEKARQLCAYPTTKPFISDLQDLFPALKESEDEKIRKVLINFFSKGAEYDSSTNGIKDRNIIAWLEKQGETVWSEETDDDAWMNDIISKVENNLQLNKAEIDWIKSLRPQNTWKPSDKQMKFLQKCIEAYNEVTFPTEVRVLSSLYNDLKKLKGEKL